MVFRFFRVAIPLIVALPIGHFAIDHVIPGNRPPLFAWITVFVFLLSAAINAMSNHEFVAWSSVLLGICFPASIVILYGEPLPIQMQKVNIIVILLLTSTSFFVGAVGICKKVLKDTAGKQRT
jgi:hypothetical protein